MEIVALFFASIAMSIGVLINIWIVVLLAHLFRRFSSKVVKTICMLVAILCPFVVTHFWVTFLRGNALFDLRFNVMQQTWNTIPFQLELVASIICAIITFICVIKAR